MARASDAWGAEIEDDGKVVWFTPAAQFSDEGTAGVITGVTAEEPSRRVRGDGVRLDIRNVPVAAYTAFQRHYRELRREVRLLALAHEARVPARQDACPTSSARSSSRCAHDLGADQIEAARRWPARPTSISTW